MKDLVSKLGPVSVLAPAVVSATATGSAIDLQGFNSAALIITTGAIAGSGDYTTKLQESDTTTSGDFADVAAADLSGSFPASLEADSIYKVGYTGSKRYVRAVTTKNSGTSVAASIVLVKGHPESAPVA